MTSHRNTSPPADWASDYDIFDPTYVENPEPIWDDLRERCPIAHTERWGGSWLATTMEDVRAIATDTETFSSEDAGVAPRVEDEEEQLEGVRFPPIDSDPPNHLEERRLILPFFSPQAVEGYEQVTREYCRGLVAGLKGRDGVDAAVEYAQQIPARVIALMLGVPTDKTDLFTHWVREILEFGGQDPERRLKAREEMAKFLLEQIQERHKEPGDDIISHLVQSELEGEPVPTVHIVGTCTLLLIAGVDTTWSGIGSSLYHFATHPDDLRRVVEEPDLLPTAIEELLRAYSPVTMGRVVTRDTEVKGCPMHEGDKVLLSWAAANRDPAEFEDPDRVLIDRQRNRHLAFGLGIHRCAGSNLARMELRVALEEWLAEFPVFELDTSREMTWAGGQVRGPRTLPVRFPTT